MSKWMKSDTKAVIDTNAGQGITANGTYYLVRSDMDTKRPFLFGARVASAGHTATVQMFAEVAGAKTDIGTALVPTNGSPAMSANEITLTGERGIVVTGIIGTVFVEAAQ